MKLDLHQLNDLWKFDVLNVYLFVCLIKSDFQGGGGSLVYIERELNREFKIVPNPAFNWTSAPIN